MRQALASRRLFARLMLCALTLTAFPAFDSAARQQSASGTPFTVEDLLEVRSLNDGELSDDGRWLAIQTASLRDRIGIDNYRFGDPTYISPTRAEVLIIDTQAGRAQGLFPDKRQVRGLKWSPDASRLALLTFADNTFTTTIWERATGRWQTVKLPAGKTAADNAELIWTPTGEELLIALRTDEWRQQARTKFDAETRASVVVHSSKEPFLAWEDLRRLQSIRSLAAYNLKTGQTREVIPQTKIGTYSGFQVRGHRWP